jgi:hypothetical protein
MSHSNPKRSPGRWVFAGLVAATVLSVSSGVVAAQVPNPPPDGSVPGGELFTQLLGWLKWAALSSGLAGLLIGAISMAVGHFGSNHSAASAGRKWLLGGMGASIVAGLAWTITTTLYAATGG